MSACKLRPGSSGRHVGAVRPRPRSARALVLRLLTLVVGFGAPLRAASAQAGNLLGAPGAIERRLRTDSLEVLQAPGSRFQQDRTQRALVRLPDSTLMQVKFGAAFPGANAFNNEPRYEVAAYDLQKLFLAPDDYVVPPTVVRCFRRDWYNAHVDGRAKSTFSHGDCVLAVLQYWLWSVHVAEPLDEALFQADTVYARHLADFNAFTDLVNHEDSNLGNYLVSDLPKSPRVFSVDNGVAFRSQPGNRGQKWRRYRLDRIGARTAARLRSLTRAHLDSALLVVAQWEEIDGVLVRTKPGPCLDDGEGVREKDGIVQLGLTRREIDGIEHRLQDLLGDVDKGKIHVF